jgi:hypothetical protein
VSQFTEVLNVQGPQPPHTARTNCPSGSHCAVFIKIKINRTIIFRVDLYGYETWSLTLREENWLKLLENRVLRKVSGPKKKR